ENTGPARAVAQPTGARVRNLVYSGPWQSGSEGITSAGSSGRIQKTWPKPKVQESDAVAVGLTRQLV
ncbi:MAG: hypothetical protein D4R84_09720, partial [Rhodocyclaceae bacterium]